MTERYESPSIVYEHDELEKKYGFGMELRGRPVDIISSAGFVGVGLMSLGMAISGVNQESSKLSHEEFQNMRLIMGAGGAFITAGGLVGIIDYLRAKDKFSLEISKKIGEIEKNIMRYGVGAGLIAGGVAAMVYGGETAQYGIDTRDVWGTIGGISAGSYGAVGGLILAGLGAAAIFIKDERSS